jgi:acetate kinase
VNDGALIVGCLNCGSSSIKGAVYRVGDGSETRVAAASREHLGDGAEITAAATAVLGELIAGAGELDAVGHRFVHGGPLHFAPVVLDATVLSELRAAEAFAPLHLPAALSAVEAVAAAQPALTQVACFDTAFHQTIPEVAWRLPIPRELAARGVRKYGFHGLSYEYVVGALGPDVLGRAVIAHLGNGASLAAIREGRSVDTTMGMTPTGGIPMGTRSGDLDPGVLLHLMREHGNDADALEQLLDHESGLKGLSGTTGDMRELIERSERGEGEATLAVDVFSMRVAMQVGAYAVVLAPLETLVFTGGIGERAARVRAEVCLRLAHLGIEMDPDRNLANAEVISPDGAPVTVRVVQTNEDLVIARHALALLRAT